MLFRSGVSGDQVVIYQGVRGDVLGVQLQDVSEQTGIKVSDLTQVGRTSVTGDSLPTSDLDAAHRTVERLRTDELLPECQPPSPIVPTQPGQTAVPTQPGQTAAPGAPVTAAAPSRSPQVPGRDCRAVQ